MEVKCGSPGNGTNTEFISITEGDPEEVYNYTCSHGFRLDPDNLTVVCQLNTNGTIASWSLTPPTCSKVKCGSPGNGTNTESISITEGDPEEAYNYTCSHGFRLDPDNLTVVCQLNTNGTIASWSLTPPTCSKVKCGSPGNGTNTESISITEGDPEEVYNYTCSHGFRLDPDNLTVVCQLNTNGTIASWSLTPPTCSKVKCGSPGNGTNTESISITEGNPEESYNYTCSHGFRLDPNNLTVVCQLNSNGTIASWSLPPPTCSTTAKIFVTDEDTEYKIFVADLQDDLDFTHIPSTKQPRSITYDSVEKKIYWADKETERVYRADVDGENREEVTSESSDGTYGLM
ncbi:C4b-binding protein alpha chain-like [Strongylocentrotus purpuratus]|uniref:Sushi domain-containing protein n=1 Tax=Strongylocentrotus purpuratus TaxID=7668 RepID=A0A7M7SXY4_STRPU|nr:C4b-binding protein alpha chain-like [Strongylocentrotus purpuratus]